MMHIVILSGGSGTRFWPLSTKNRPKQLLPIVTKRSMLSMTIERILPLKPEKIWIVTRGDQAEITQNVLTKENPTGQSGIPLEILVEPTGKNTAPAIALAAMHINRIAPKATMVVLPADHHIRLRKKFLGLLEGAAAIAQKSKLVTLGIQTTRPETGYGYIERTNRRIGEGFLVKQFIEKPPIDRAKQYHTRKEFYWNSGMFVWRVDVFFYELKAHEPTIEKAFSALQKHSPTTRTFAKLLQNAYQALPSISIDYALMERSKNVAVLPASIGWSDVGSWPSLFDLKKKKGEALFCNTETIALESKQCLVHSESKKLVALVGVENLVIVETEEAILVTTMNEGQRVGEIPKRLK